MLSAIPIFIFYRFHPLIIEFGVRIIYPICIGGYLKSTQCGFRCIVNIESISDTI